MSSTARGLQDVRVQDLSTFLTVKRLRTMAAAARELKVTPSQVTKAMARLESQLGVRLFARAGRSATLTEVGARLAPAMEALIEQLRSARQPDHESSPSYAFAAPSFLYELFMPKLAAQLSGVRLRGVELAPTLLRALAGENLFDLALLTEKVWMPAHWVVAQIGELRSALFGSPALARELGSSPVDEGRVRELTFVGPLYVSQGQMLRGEDFCPLPFAERRFGHEVQTIHTALELAAATRQVVFGPVIAAGPLVRARRLQEIRVEGWDVSSPLHFAVNGDRVLARVQKAMTATLRQALKSLEREAR